MPSDDPSESGLDAGLLSPVTVGFDDVVTDAAFLDALVTAEVALVRAWTEVGVGDTRARDAIADRFGWTAPGEPCSSHGLDVGAIATDAVAGGNPVIPLIAAMKAALPVVDRGSIHRGATSQDILDSAVMLVARRASDERDRAPRAHRGGAQRIRAGAPGSGRCGAHAHAARGSHDGRAARGELAAWCPACTCAARSRSRLAPGAARRCRGNPGRARRDRPRAPRQRRPRGGRPTACRVRRRSWGSPHRRRPGTRTAGPSPNSATRSCRRSTPSACSRRMSRRSRAPRSASSPRAAPADPRRCRRSRTPRHPSSSARPRSARPTWARPSTRPRHRAVDERPDGAWHAEWPTLRELMRLALGATGTAARLVAGLRVDDDAVARNVALTGGLIVAERLVIELTPHIGRTRVDEILAAGMRGEALAPLIQQALQHASDREGRSAFPVGGVEALLDPANYTGLATRTRRRRGRGCDRDRPRDLRHRTGRAGRGAARRARAVARHVDDPLGTGRCRCSPTGSGSSRGICPGTGLPNPRVSRSRSASSRMRSPRRSMTCGADRVFYAGVSLGGATGPRAAAAASGDRRSCRHRRLRRAARRACRLARAGRAGARTVDVVGHHRVGAALVRARLDRPRARPDRPAAPRSAGRRRRELCALLRGARRLRRARSARRDRGARARAVGRARRGGARGEVGRDRGGRP